MILVGAVLVAPFATSARAEAHSGGLDASGGHHCREAGYKSGTCAPLDSYHCHRSPCGEAAPATTTTTRRATTTTTAKAAAPPPPPPTTTTAPPPTTTTAAPTTTTTAAPTTTTEVTIAELPAADPAAKTSDKGDEGNPVVGFVLLAGMGYGGYRLVKRLRSGPPPAPPADEAAA